MNCPGGDDLLRKEGRVRNAPDIKTKNGIRAACTVRKKQGTPCRVPAFSEKSIPASVISGGSEKAGCSGTRQNKGRQAWGVKQRYSQVWKTWVKKFPEKRKRRKAGNG